MRWGDHSGSDEAMTGPGGKTDLPMGRMGHSGPPDARYVRGTVWKLLLFTAIPMLPGTLSLAGYNIANTYFLSELGTDPLAVMGYVFPVTMLVSSLFVGLAVGVAAPMAQAIGRGEQAEAVRIATLGILLLTLVSLLCGSLGIWFMDWTFSLYGAKPELLPLIAEYMEVWYAGCFTVALMMLGNHLLIGSGNPMYAGGLMLFGMTINVVLDYWFIFGAGPIPAMGIRGAALGTVISQGCAAFLSLAVQQFRHRMISLSSLRRLKPVIRSLRSILWMASSLLIGYLLVPLGNNVILWIVSQFGKEAVAAVA
ncbi:MAG: MATE family efflux transporter, partial [Planctomycetia bacterium]|nr:MATE family efflux transporter [Planctomycetia bacterium]